MSNISMGMSYKCSNRREILFDQLRVRFIVVLMCKIGIKYQYFSRVVCAYAHIFQKRPGVCAYWSMCANLNEYGIMKIRSKMLAN